MNRSFGPWSTAIGTGAPQQLNTFWKRRLAMLPSLGQSTSGTARRTVFFLAVIAISALALPTLKWATDAQAPGLVVVFADDVAQPTDGKVKTPVEQRAKSRVQPQDKEPAPDVEYFPRPSRFEEQVLAALEKPVDVDFSKMPLKDCIEHLRKESKIPFYIDQQTLTDEGVALDQPITLKLKATPLESVLNLLLHPMQLAYFPENEVLMITTETKAGEKLITRTYPVPDLVRIPKGGSEQSTGAQREAPANTTANQAQPPAAGTADDKKPPVEGGAGAGGAGAGGTGGGGRGGEVDARGRVLPGPGVRYVPPRDGLDFTSLMNLMSTQIAPDSWEDLSGPGSMMPHRLTKSIVIRQTWAVHRQVLQLLRDLREAKQLVPVEKTKS